jgi:hypothetical protein
VVLVELYGDKHGSEESARAIHKMIEEQQPEAIFYELDLTGKDLEHFEKALTEYATVGDFYSAFGKDPDIEGVTSETPLFDLDTSTVEDLTEKSFNGFPKRKHIAAIKSPDKTVNSQEEDLALYALLHQFMVRRSDSKNTLASRVFFECKKNGIKFQKIDIDRNEMWIHGAREISKLPDKPEKVKKQFKQFRKGKQAIMPHQQNMLEGVDKLTDEFDSKRESMMAAQVEDELESNGYENAAAVIGRAHLKPVKKFLLQHNDYRIELNDPEGSSGVLGSVKDFLILSYD